MPTLIHYQTYPQKHHFAPLLLILPILIFATLVAVALSQQINQNPQVSGISTVWDEEESGAK